MKFRDKVASIIVFIYLIIDFSTVLYTNILPPNWLNIAFAKLFSSILLFFLIELLYIFYDAFRGNLSKDSFIVRFLRLSKQSDQKSKNIGARYRLMFVIMFLSLLSSAYTSLASINNSTLVFAYSELSFFINVVTAPLAWYIVFKILFIIFDYIKGYR